MTYSPFTATGDGSTTAYTIAFDYIDTADVKARVNDVVTTAFSVSGSTVTFTAAPPNGQSIKIYRDTDNQTIQADFQSGSTLRAVDLNSNFTQLLYVTQESTDVADTASTDAASAVTSASNAVTTANTASTNATTAVSTANTASTNATAAVNTANTASTNASAAVSTANSAASDASTALSTANAATTTANTANTTANSATTTANAASSTANTASTNASNAVTTANAASATATAASNAVNAVLVYDPIANVSSIPGSPSDGDRIEIADSSGIQSFSPLTGMPSGFTGSSQLSVRLNYTSSGSTWNWTDYAAQDPDARYYLKSSGDTNATNIATKMPLAGGTFTGLVTLSGAPTANLHAATKAYVDSNSGNALPLSGGTLTGALTLSGAPTANLHAATKQYVDDNATGVIVADGGNFANGTSLVSTSTTYDGGSFD